MPPASMWSIGWRQPSKYRPQTSSSDPRPPAQGSRPCSMANGRELGRVLGAAVAVREKAPPGGRAGRLS